MNISPTTLRRLNAATGTGTAGSTIPTSGSTGATGAASASQPGGALGKDEFMKLLIAQMQNQDPMNPMQGDQMAAQLAQFSTLEQMQQMNATLTSQSGAAASLLGAVQSNAAIGAIGHNIVAVGDDIQLGGNNGASTVQVNVANAGTSATLKILDGTGKVVGSRDLGAIGAGKQTIDVGDAGKGLSGKYTYEVDVKDANGNAVTVTPYMTGKVTGVASTSNGLVLNVGDLEIPYANVIQVLN